MIALSVAKLKIFSPESEIFLWIKPEKKKKIVESLDQCRRLEEREKARFFCDEPTSVWPQGVTQHCIFIKFFRFRSYFVLQIFGEFNKIIIPFALVGYETGYSQLGATRLVGYLPSHIQRALME